MRLLIVLAAPIACWTFAESGVAQADKRFEVHKNLIWTACRENDDDMSAVCSAYVMGAIDALAAEDVNARRHLYCLPDNITGGALRGVLQDFMRNNESAKQADPGTVFYWALKERWPCTGANKK